MLFFGSILYFIFWQRMYVNRYRMGLPSWVTDTIDGIGWVLIVAFFVGLIGGHAVTHTLPLDAVTKPIYSLKTIGYNNTSGSMYAISSNGGESYVVLHKTDKGYKKTFLRGNSTYINETHSTEPSVVYRRSQDVYDSKWFYLPWMYGRKCKVETHMDGAVINVPTGTIVKEFTQIH